MIASGWLAALLLVAASAAADPPAAPTETSTAAPLASWHGQWAGEGTAFGQQARATLTIGPALGGGATRLEYALAIDGAQPVRYFAQGLYRVDAKRRVSGDWTDSYGRHRPIGGWLEERLWTVHWGSADSEIGRSTYALEGDGSLRVSDSVLQPDGSWRVFAMLRYRRSIGG
jgi:hypothetical protein